MGGMESLPAWVRTLWQLAVALGMGGLLACGSTEPEATADGERVVDGGSSDAATELTDSGGVGSGGDAGGSPDGSGPDAGEPDGVDGGSDEDASVFEFPQEGVCFETASAFAALATGNGSCGLPFVIDMTGGQAGDSFKHETGTALLGGPVPGLDKCGQAGERDLVYNLSLPSGMDVEVSVAGAKDADPILLLQRVPDTSCSAADVTACMDENGPGQCEYMRAGTERFPFEGTTAQLVVSEKNATATSYRLHFRLVRRGGGA